MVDGRRTDGRTDDDGRRLDGYSISSPCEPNGSGELIKSPLELFMPYSCSGSIYMKQTRIKQNFVNFQN